MVRGGRLGASLKPGGFHRSLALALTGELDLTHARQNAFLGRDVPGDQSILV
jgi:hypothetical protein